MMVYKIDDEFSVEFSVDKDNDIQICITGPSFTRYLGYLPSYECSPTGIKGRLTEARKVVAERKRVQLTLKNVLSGEDAKLLSESQEEMEEVLK